MNNLPYFYERTKHPKIYACCYWGHFKNEEEDQEIIDNRNNFIPEFNIKAYYRMPKYMTRKCEKIVDLNTKYKIDHIETYKTRDNKCVIVNSPYFVTDQEEKDLLELGYVKYKPIYSTSAKTYVYVTDIGRF